jgi:hypothetical protein
MDAWERIRRALFVAVVTVLASANVIGFPYYVASAQDRMRHSLRPWFKPSGPAGQSLGLLAFLLFLFLWLYPVRKQFPSLAATGSVPRWLDFHIAAGILVPWVAATHAAWRFNGLIGLGYAAMVVVALSGVVGRYLYTRIPRSRSGIELSREEASAERRALLGTISEATGLAPDEIEEALSPAGRQGSADGILSALFGMVADDLARRRTVHSLVRRLASAGGSTRRLDGAALRSVARLARRQVALTQQARMLDAIQRVFRLWHAGHRPFAVMLLIAVLVHVGVAIAVGQAWFR